MEQRQADLLPVPYYHVVFTLPAPVAAIAFGNKAVVVYDLPFHTAADTLLTLAADPKHLGARIGLNAVLHTLGRASLRLQQAQRVGKAGGGSAMTHHPHLHMIVPGGGIMPDGQRWVSSRPAFLLPIHVFSRLFRRLFLAGLIALHDAGRLRFFGDQTGLSDRRVFLRHLAPFRRMAWVVYAKPPFAGPEAVSPTCRATLTASRSRTGGSSPSTRPASPSAPRTIAAKKPARAPPSRGGHRPLPSHPG